MRSLGFVGLFICASVGAGLAQQKYATPVYMPISLKKNPCDHAQTQAEGRLYIMSDPSLENSIDCSMSYDPDVKRIYSDRKGRYLVDSFTVTCYKLSNGATPSQPAPVASQSTCSRWHPHIKPVKATVRFDDTNIYEKFHVLLYVKQSKYKDTTYCTINPEPLPSNTNIGSKVVNYAYRTMCVHPVGN